MRVKIVGRVVQNDSGDWTFPILAKRGSPNPLVTLPKDQFHPEDSDAEPLILSPQQGLMLYRRCLVQVFDAHVSSSEEILLRVRHAVLSRERSFQKMRREVEAFENFEKLSKTPREPIPADVRMFVWQRDGGKCIRCGGAERLEYDHIIPLAKGGSNTERNIQLLCEPCNRSKGVQI
jgi:hypothetical protein